MNLRTVSSQQRHKPSITANFPLPSSKIAFVFCHSYFVSSYNQTLSCIIENKSTTCTYTQKIKIKLTTQNRRSNRI